MKPLLLFGKGEFSTIVRSLATQCGRQVVGVIDETLKSQDVYQDLDSAYGKFPPNEVEIALSIGYSNLGGRWKVRDKIKSAGYELATLIHPKAHVHDRNKIKAGSLLMVGSIIDVNAVIEEAVVVWPGVVVNHDSCIGANTFLSPSCTICGFVNVGQNVFIGAGAVVADHVNVPDSHFIKAGSVYSEGRSV